MVSREQDGGFRQSLTTPQVTLPTVRRDPAAVMQQ